MTTTTNTPAPARVGELTRVLNPKRAAFVREYLIDRNGTAAAIRAGYAPNAARAQACTILKDIEVQAEIHRHAKKNDANLAELYLRAALTRRESRPKKRLVELSAIQWAIINNFAHLYIENPKAWCCNCSSFTDSDSAMCGFCFSDQLILLESLRP